MFKWFKNKDDESINYIIKAHRDETERVKLENETLKKQVGLLERDKESDRRYINSIYKEKDELKKEILQQVDDQHKRDLANKDNEFLKFRENDHKEALQKIISLERDKVELVRETEFLQKLLDKFNKLVDIKVEINHGAIKWNV